MKKIIFATIMAALPAVSHPQAAAAGNSTDFHASYLVVQVKTKKKSPAPSYRREEPRHGDKLVGRAPSRSARSDDAMSNFLGGVAQGVAGGFMGGVLGGFGGTSGSGCQVDYTTANPVGCGGSIASPRGDNGMRGPYKCQGKNGWYTTNTFRPGCYMASMDRPGSRPSDILGRSVGN